jgi:thiamine biosynthesis lipoprotein
MKSFCLNRAYTYIPIFLLLFLPSPISAQNDTTMYEVTVSKYLMGTTVDATARCTDVNYCKEALVSAYKEMERIDHLMSCENDSSEISKINRSAGIGPVKVSQETLGILERSKAYAEKYNGIFDVTIGPLSDLWGFSSDREVVLPQDSIIQKLKKLVNFRDLIINEKDTTAFLNKKGMSIDLGGIAKGYAVDRGSAVLKNNGITNFILNAGGDIYVSGTKGKDEQWKIGIKHPRKTNDIIAAFNLRDYAVATSGDYERFKIINGVRYHHILLPATGYPGTLSESSTIIAPTTEEAVTVAKFIFLIGWQKTFSDKELNFPMLIVASDGSIHYNKIFADKYNLELVQ